MLIAVAGVISDTAFFESNYAVSWGDRDAFVAQYTNNGQFSWLKSGGGPNRDAISLLATGGMYVDPNNNIFVTGGYSDSMIIGTDTLRSARWEDDMFLAKFSSNGDYAWAIKAGSNSSEHGTDVRCDPSGNIYVTGDFDYGILFDTLWLAWDHPNGGNVTGSPFIVKYDSMGKAIWARTAKVTAPPSAPGSGGVIYGGNLSVDNDGNAYVIGLYEDCTVKFGFQPAFTSLGGDIYIVKYNTQGVVQWAKTVQASSFDVGYAICNDKAGNVYVSGSFGNECYFGNDTIRATGGYDTYVLKLDPDGNLLWHTTSQAENCLSIAADANDNIYVTGFYTSSPCNFGNITLTNAGGRDMYVAKLSQTVGVPTVSSTPVTKVYPSPASGMLHVSAASFTSYIIYDHLGRNVKEQFFRQTMTAQDIDISSFADGIFFLRLLNSNHLLPAANFVVRH